MIRISLPICGLTLLLFGACSRSDKSTTTPAPGATPNPPAVQQVAPPAEPPVTIEPDIAPVPSAAPVDSTPVWIADLASDDSATRDAATSQLAELDDHGEMLRRLLTSHDEPSVRRGAAFGLLSEFDTRDAAQTASMLQALDDSDEIVRRVALQAVSQWSQDDPIAAEIAIEQLSKIIVAADHDDSERSQAVRILGRLGSAAQPVLIRVFSQDADPNVRKAALAAAIRTNPSAGSIVQPLITVLQTDDNAAMRRQAALHLRRYGGSEEVHAALASAFDDTDRDVRIEAADSLAAIGQPAFAFTLGLLDGDSNQRRLYGALTLGKMGRIARPAIPRLRELSNDSDPNVSRMAAGVIRVIEASQR